MVDVVALDGRADLFGRHLGLRTSVLDVVVLVGSACLVTNALDSLLM